MFEQRRKKEKQSEFWIATSQLPKATPSRFYELVEKLEEIGFAERVYELCKRLCRRIQGRAGIDPVVYLKMLMVGFFEGLESERAISSRCADVSAGLSGYSLSEPTPEHSSLTVIRQRLGVDIYQGVFELMLDGMCDREI